eukprot:2888374-Pleurochrysis_carterae.AAC.1
MWGRRPLGCRLVAGLPAMPSEAVERKCLSFVGLFHVLRVLASCVGIGEIVGDGAGSVWRWRAGV